MAKCSVEDDFHSESGRLRKGMCALHYRRVHKYGDPYADFTCVKTVNGGQCAAPECTATATHSALCKKHYKRLRKNGDVRQKSSSAPLGINVGKKEYVRQYKLAHGCHDCGFAGHYAALDFDHLPGTDKLGDIGSGDRWTWEALLLEIGKCEVVCANCHRIRTVVRWGDDK